MRFIIPTYLSTFSFAGLRGSFYEMTPQRNILLLARFSKRSERDRTQKRSRNYLEDDAALAFMGMTLVAAWAGLMLQYRSASCLVTNSL
jgi:hypothetical protein